LAIAHKLITQNIIIYKIILASVVNKNRTNNSHDTVWRRYSTES